MSEEDNKGRKSTTGEEEVTSLLSTLTSIHCDTETNFWLEQKTK